MKVCSKCGAEFSDDYNFCEKCGEPLTGDSTDKKTDTSEVPHRPVRVAYTYKENTSLSQFVQLIQHYGARIMRVAALLMHLVARKIASIPSGIILKSITLILLGM